MTLDQKRLVIAGLGIVFLLSLVAVQWLEVSRRQHEAGDRRALAASTAPASSRQCVDCHTQVSRGIVDHWTGSTHAEKGVGCVDCHKAEAKDADVFAHYGAQIATIVSPRDCARCHPTESAEFAESHHAKAGNILASLDNFLAETVEGSRATFSPHSPTPGKAVQAVNGMAPANSGCQQCHGSLVAFQANDGGMVTTRDLKPDQNGQPTNMDAVGRIVRNENGKPLLHSTSLAQHRHRPHQLRRLAGLVRRLPQPARLLGTTGAPAGKLRQVSPRSGSPAEGDLRRVEARRGLPRPDRRHEPRRAPLGARPRLLGGADLRHLPYGREYA